MTFALSLENNFTIIAKYVQGASKIKIIRTTSKWFNIGYAHFTRTWTLDEEAIIHDESLHRRDENTE